VASGGTGCGGYVAPTVLLDVPESSAAVQEETFGPTLTTTEVAEALARVIALVHRRH
jgi:acyl-CoA reductase-like NAD-dependent aldehyde dehydrogenase